MLYSAQGGLNEQFAYILGKKLAKFIRKYRGRVQTKKNVGGDGNGQTFCGSRRDWD